jgi:hypothetical protein
VNPELTTLLLLAVLTAVSLVLASFLDDSRD